MSDKCGSADGGALRPRAATFPGSLFEIRVVDQDQDQNDHEVDELVQHPTSRRLSLQIMPSGGENLPPDPDQFLLDECPALLAQVPDGFDLGRTRVRLNSVAASPRFVALGSECGALFLFNRRIGQGVKPLRTNHREVITAMAFSNGASDLLAVGHQSGKLVILALPSSADGGNQKLLQHIQDEAHQSAPVYRLYWSDDGHALFSADQRGLVLATHVDFANDQFPLTVISEGGSESIVAMASAGTHLAVATRGQCRVYNWRRDGELVAEFGRPDILAIHLADKGSRLALLRSDGTIWANSGDLAVSDHPAVLEQFGVIPTSPWDLDGNQPPNVLITRQGWVLWALDGPVMLVSGLGHGAELETKMAMMATKENTVGQVIAVCATLLPSSSSSSDFELFLLCAPSVHPLQQSRRVFRLAPRHSPTPPALTAPLPVPLPTAPLLSTFLCTAAGKAMGEWARLRKATAMDSKQQEEVWKRWNRELDVFLMGDGTRSGRGDEHGGMIAGKIADLFPALPEEYGTRLASGLQQMLDQVRQQSANILFQTEGEERKETEEEEEEMEGRSGETPETEEFYWSVAGTSTTPPGGPKRMEEESSGEWKEKEAEGDDDDDEKRMRGREVKVQRRRIVVVRKGRSRHREEKRKKKVDDEDEEKEEMLVMPGGWDDGVGREVSEERQHRILEELGIVPKSAEEVEGRKNEEDDMEDNPILRVDDRKRDEEREEHERDEGGGGGGGGYAFPEEEIQQPEEEEEQRDGQKITDPLSPAQHHSMSLADLLRLFPPPAPSLPPHPYPHLQPSSTIHPLHLHPSSPPSVSSASSSSLPPALRPAPLYRSLLRLPSAPWLRLPTPFPVIGDFAICRHFVLACPGGGKKKKAAAPHFLKTDRLAERRMATDAWVPLRAKANAVAVNDSGSLLWRLWDGVAYAPCASPDPRSPSATFARSAEWEEKSSPGFEGDVVQVALNAKNAWYLAERSGVEGTQKKRAVFVQMCLPEMGIFFRAMDEEDQCYQFAHLAVSDHAVWALSGGIVVARTGLKMVPMGTDWADMEDAQPRKFVSIALYDHTGFGLDRAGNVWFVHGVAEESPFGHGPWFKDCSLSLAISSSSSGLPDLSRPVPTSEWRLRVGAPGVFVSIGSALFHSSGPLVGSHFEHVVPDRLALNDHFAMIAASGFSGISNDSVFLCQPGSDELFSFSLRRLHFTSFPAPYGSNSAARVRCIAATPAHLLVLDTCGQLCGTQAASDCCWTRLNTPARLISVGACSDSVWAISNDDDDGNHDQSTAIWAARWPESDSDNPASTELRWERVAGPRHMPANGERNGIDQIRLSPSGNAVWLFSSRTGQCWARRRDLTSNCGWKGRAWKLIRASSSPSVRIRDLALGDNGAVWALAHSTDQLLRWCPLSASRPFAGCWRPLEFRLNALSVDAMDGRLWALDTQFRLVRHELDVYPRGAASLHNKQPEEGEDHTAGEHTPLLSRARELPRRTLSGHSLDSAASWHDLMPDEDRDDDEEEDD